MFNKFLGVGGVREGKGLKGDVRVNGGVVFIWRCVLNGGLKDMVYGMKIRGGED